MLRTVSSIASNNVQKPTFAFRPRTLKKIIRYFLEHLEAKPLYAVKANPEAHIIHALYSEGIEHFDVASIAEIAHIRALYPNAQLYYMHPMKPSFAIHQAYHRYGVRHFSLDSKEELNKILSATGNANDLNLFVRTSIPNSYAEINLGEKFGVNLQQAPELLRMVRQKAQKLGICFHVGSQCMHPDAYRIAIRMMGVVIKEANIPIEFFNIGGGFPSIYPGMIPPSLHEYFSTIKEEFYRLKSHAAMELLCEPGRAFVAETTSVIVRVDGRKSNILYINDGTYGSLFDAGIPHFIFPVRLLNGDKHDSSDLIPFSFYGPTCDTLDFMKGPFYLPKNVKEGDYIEVGQIGAYGRALATGFNGFEHETEVIMVHDKPLMTMYDEKKLSEQPLEIIAA